jgi:hypothetical protein
MPSERKYAERLREQAYKTLSPQLKDLEKELQELSDSVSNGVYRLERKIEAVSRVELPTTEVVLDEIMDEVLRRKKEDEKTLASFVRDVRRKDTQEEILGLLLDCAGEFFQKAALFSVRGDSIVGWSSRGYEEESARKIADLSLSLAACPEIHDIVKGEAVVPAPDLVDLGEIACLQTEPEGSRYFAPLYVLDRPVALLYAAHSGEEAADDETLTVLAHLAAFSVENIALRILYSLAEDGTGAPALEEAPEIAPEPEEEAIPEPATAVEPIEEQSEETPDRPEPEQAEEALPPPVPEDREAFSREPEEISESDGLVEKTAEPAVEEPVPESAPVPEALAKEDEEKVHADAKRFARLLVSEIKLYNQNQVVEGRRHKDLYLRLKRDIDKSREMFERRVPPEVTHKIDYFHDEIVRILGDNDPSTLGSDYPGSESSE